MKATQLEQMRETFVYIKATKQATQHKIEQQNEVRKPSKGFLYKVSHGTSPTVYLFWMHVSAAASEKAERRLQKGGRALQEPGFCGWNSNQTGRITERNGLGVGEIIWIILF